MKMIQVARDAQVHHVGGLVRRKKVKASTAPQVSEYICFRINADVAGAGQDCL